MGDEVLGAAKILAAIVEIYDEDGVSGFLAGQGVCSGPGATSLLRSGRVRPGG